MTINGIWKGYIHLYHSTLKVISLTLIFFSLHAEVPNQITWDDNMEGIYSAKSGFKWLQRDQGGNINTYVWSTIWKLKCPEKIKVLLWTEWHNSNPTMQVLHHRGVVSSSSLHAFRDCSLSMDMWKALGFREITFFAHGNAHDWICSGMEASSACLFLVGIWGAWRARNLKCLAQEDS